MGHWSIKLPVFIVLLALTATNAKAKPLVPFVGCPGGDMTSVYPPFQGESVSVDMDPLSAAHLAFYAANPSDKKVGVLAPRGWHCNFQDSSGGFMLVVVPHTMAPPFDFTEKDTPRVLYQIDYGGTSGRFALANYVKTYFPSLDSSVSDTLDEEKQFPGETALAPGNGIQFPNDTISRIDPETLAFVTPRYSTGLGASERDTSSFPTSGFLHVYLHDDGLAILVSVRLPKNLGFLKTAILNDERHRVKQMESP
jgi:hypothetical protein